MDLIKELKRQLRNAKKGLTCGAHPGMSCSEAHQDDLIQILQLQELIARQNGQLARMQLALHKARS